LNAFSITFADGSRPGDLLTEDAGKTVSVIDLAKPRLGRVGVVLCGRERERAVIDALLAAARDGRSGVLVVRGEAGIGKSSLLEYAACAAEAVDGMPVLRGVGIESEAGVPFAGLHLLLHGSLDRLSGLPRTQADALRGALGVGNRAGGDRFLVGLAVLSLLAELAGDGALLCLVDDAQWIDQASVDALLFAAHRLEEDGVLLVFAARDEGRPFRAPGLPELRLGRLDEPAASELLAAHSGQLDADLHRQVLAEAGGNPLALLELPAVLRAESRRGATDPAEAALSAPRRMEQVYQAVIETLPPRARELLLVAATEDSGELSVVLRAGRAFDASVHDLAELERADLVRLTPTRITFRHPLIRAAAYHGAPLTSRWSAHRALADALAGQTEADAERRAHHLAALATEPDETVAGELHGSAERALRRGALAAAMASYERAAQLSPDPGTAAQRRTLAAEAAEEVGEYERAVELVDDVSASVDDPLLRARVATVRGHASYALGQLPLAYRHLHEAVSLLREHDRPRASWLLMEMVRITRATADTDAGLRTVELLDTLRLAPTHPLVPIQQLLRWSIYRQLGRDTTRLPPLPDVAAAALDVSTGGLREQLFTADACLAAGDSAQAYEVADSLANTVRTQGAIGLLPQALTHLAYLQVYCGRHRDARATATEAGRIARATGEYESISQAESVLALVAAIEGDGEACRIAAKIALEPTGDRAGSPGRSGAEWALGLLDLGLGRPASALARLDALARGSSRLQMRVLRSAPDLVEAAVCVGEPHRAGEALLRYEQWADQTGRAWIDAMRSRCRALLAADDRAERHFVRALQQHDPGRPVELARTQLLYGEWLRRARRRSEARTQLRAALEALERVGARPWVDRARNELRATGETVTTREGSADLLDRLTPQELQVVRMAATGLSNRAIGARLFLSPRTVGYHLYKAYPKLGVASRGELARLTL
jgi:DNA-binding CsgD family transcriptional regulator